MDAKFSGRDSLAAGPHPTGNLLAHLPSRALTHVPLESNQAAGVSSIIPTNLESQEPKPIVTSRSQPGAVISQIEDLFESMTDCIIGEKKELVIQLKSRSRTHHQTDSPRNIANKKPKSDLRAITFPSRSPQEAWKFTALLRILELSHEALVTGTVTTKRDIYYRDPELFVKQAVVNRYVDDLAYTLGVERDALNVVAAAKGLAAGPFTLIKTDNTVVDYAAGNEGILIPSSKQIENIQFRNARWILVIEKEATFRTLATTEYFMGSSAGPGIIITAKGYPDIQTRQFIHLISIQLPSVPMYALVDFDPDGIGIMSTYKHGSMALAHESSSLTAPSMEWLGVRSSDIMRTTTEIQGLLRLSARDRRIAMKMLEREMFEEGACEAEWRRELQLMLMLNVKADIQILGNGEKLMKWLDEKLLRGGQAT